MTNPALRRRYVLRSVAGTLALPSMCSLSSRAVGEDSAVLMTRGAGIGARRFVAVGNLLGFQLKHFFPSTTDDGIEETRLLKPLSSNRQRVNVYRGLDHGLRGGHFAVHTFLSGVLHHESKHRKNGNVTVDQFIADEVGRQTRFASLTVGSEGGIHGGCQLSWTRSGIRIPPITGPAELFERLFVTDSKEVQAGKVKANALQASILDSVWSEAKLLSQKVNSEDKTKLDEYFTSIRDVEKRLDARQQWASSPKPSAPFEKPADTNTVNDLPLLYELIALALQTDSTRVATLEIGGSFLPQHLGIDKSYHSLSHHGNDDESVEKLVKLETYQLEQFNAFLNRLAAIQDGEQKLLDSTAVLFGSGMANANSHTNTDLPIILAGGGYGQGQFRDVRAEGAGRIPLCNLLLDIAQKMGVRSDQFGTSTGTFS